MLTREGHRRILAFLTLLFVTATGCGRDTIPPREDYRQAAVRVSAFIEREMTDKELPALSIALVDGAETVWARGFGFADPADSTPASAATVYRVGSVSKLFTDLAIMQLVERGELELDAPITEYLPDFDPENPFGQPQTLRQLMSHRSGLVREPPAGHYFDDTEPTLAATIRSLNATRLAYEPESHIKYSNAAIATVGYVLERATGTPFTEYLQAAVLDPLGMDASSFAPRADVVRNLASAFMWTYDGRTFEAPTFQLGMAPAGSMYAPVTDLAKFMIALFEGGGGERGRVVAPETLTEMLTPQFAPPGASGGFGIGFALAELDGHRLVGHGGAIYGFATELATLPDDRIGVVAVTTMDGANAVVERITTYALRTMLAVKAKRDLPEPEVTTPVPQGLAERVAGRYGSGEHHIEITVRNGDVHALPRRPGLTLRLRRLAGDTLVVDDRLAFGSRVVPLAGGIVAAGDTLQRVPSRKPPEAPDRWLGLIGEYGWDHNTLYVLEKDGQLHALIEWFFLYPLTELSRDTFAFPPWGLYDGERLVFSRDAEGRADRVEAAGVVFERRPVGTEAGVTFTIEPVRPVDELRREALAAEPPVESGDVREPDLVELRTLAPTVRYDIRYATTNNFMQSVFYDEPHAFMQRPAAEALARAHRALMREGYGLLIHDAYRPWYVTKMFWDATPADKKIFVANPADGSRHNRGAAVDLTLYHLATGEPVQMVGGYDEFSDRSFPDYPGGTSLQRWHRQLLRTALEAEGFRVYDFEWWHFDYQDWSRYPILNVPFARTSRTP